MPARPIRILLIEPEFHMARALERALRRVGDVVLTSAASYALEWLSAGQRFDVIVCAVMMRHLTGLEFHRRARWIDAPTADRIVFLSGGMPAKEEREVRALPNVLLEKPVPLERLVDAVLRAAGHAAGEAPAP